MQLSTDSPRADARQRELEAVVALRRRELASNGRLIEELTLDLGYSRSPKKNLSASVSNSECTPFFIHVLYCNLQYENYQLSYPLQCIS